MTTQMSLERYREVAAPLPKPSLAQMQAFARHVRKSHSWYKKLPLLPPGLPFAFFLDPGAGLSRVVREDQLLDVKPRTTGDLFHYSWLPTDEHRERFGYLAYAVLPPLSTTEEGIAARDTSVSLDAPPHGAICLSEGTSEGGPTLLDPGLGHDVLLPLEARAAIAHVSGLIHDGAFDLKFNLRRMLSPSVEWPSDSGGAAALAEIQTRCKQLLDGAVRVSAPDIHRDRTRSTSLFGDWILDRLVEPERQRQLSEMVNAMESAIAVVSM